MENQDERICQLIREVIQYPDGSTQQKQALDRLPRLISKVPGIYKDNNPQINYQDAFNQALANLVGVSLKQGTVSGKNIRSFIQKTKLDLDNVEAKLIREHLIKWFNKILKRRILDLYRILGQQPLSLDKLMNGEEGGATYLEQLPDLSPNGFELLITEEDLQENQKIEAELKQSCEQLTELLSCHPRGYFHCTCHELIRRRLLIQPPQKWEDITVELNVPFGTITSHWKRKCQPLLKNLANL
ncbi:hypothetical protein [Kamptonema sp. UHCC 0994]|uniref:hypothetical protein n=1 Tax=Kamptonema sp. UHCC 0994 TaxID=3031329 RepID=UPI0023B93C96|nr:hypothetical protein [Kamptonema sp. UHCC 0994]MDF0555615.1 hypothetical protein [Kamptonema sp. UHCC 0994]